MKNLTMLILIIASISNKSISQNIAAKTVENCQTKEVKLLVEHHSRRIHFFFRETYIEKNKRTDKIVDENGNVIVRCQMKSTSDHDQYFYKTFHRLVIANNQIHEVIIKKNKILGQLIIYDYCGQIIKKEMVDSGKLYDEYNFNQVFLYNHIRKLTHQKL